MNWLRKLFSPKATISPKCDAPPARGSASQPARVSVARPNPEEAAPKTFQELCKTGTPEQVQKAIDQGADVNASGQHGGTPLMDALDNPDIEVIGLLVEAGANVNARTVKGQTPLMIAAMSKQDPNLINALIEAGADVNAENHYGWSALKWAAQENPNPEVITALIEGGADVRTPGLLHACESRNRNKDAILAVLRVAGAR